MNQREIDELKSLLKRAVPPVGDATPPHDLWPAMLRRLDYRTLHIPWWDWVLLAGAGLLTLIFPSVIPALLYHL